MPDCKVPIASLNVSGGNRIAVGQENGCFVFVGFDTRAVDRKNVRAVHCIGDTSEPFRFTLRAIDPTATIQTRESLVGFWIDKRRETDFEGAIRDL